MAFGDISSSGGSSKEDLGAAASASVDAVFRFFKMIYLEVLEDGLAQGKGTDDAENEWVVTVKGEPESVERFATQNDGMPIEYEMSYNEAIDDEEGAITEEGVSTLAEEIADSEQQLDIEFALSLNQETAYEYDSVSFKIQIDPSVGKGRYDRYRISINTPPGAVWEGFAIRYKFEGHVKFIPASAALSGLDVPASSGFNGALVATSNPTGVFEFIVKGMASPMSYYKFDPTGSINLLDIVRTEDEAIA